MADNPVVDEEYISQIEKARRLLRGIVTSLHYTATFQILAIHYLLPKHNIHILLKIMFLLWVVTEGVRNKIRRMGLSASDLVALAGAWAVSRKHREKLEHDDLWYITTPLKFDNSYFAELLEDERQDRVILPGYKFLLEDPYRPYVEQYAEDEDAFFRDYAEAHKKFSELGFTTTPTSTSSEVQVARDCVFNSPLTQSLVLVAFGYIGAVMVLSYFFELKRKTC